MRPDIEFRIEQPEDYRTVERLTREAFWNLHVPGCNEHYLLHTLRAADCFIRALDIVALRNGEIVGHIAYTRAVLCGDDGIVREVLTFGPLCVLPIEQGRGIGGALVRYSLALAREMGYPAVLIYGDPAYYSRFGFVAAEQYGIATADDQYAPALQALELVPGALSGSPGRFVEDAAYHVNDADAEDFERNFAPKPKLEGLPSQLRFMRMIASMRPRK